MYKRLLVLVAVVSTCFSWSPPKLYMENNISFNDKDPLDEIKSNIIPYQEGSYRLIAPYDEIRDMLYHESDTLSWSVIEKALMTLRCIKERNVDYNNILTIIDYSLPSSEKRLWVFDLDKKKLLFHTYVSHGIKSGTLLTKFFSNKFNSKASSIGIYTTEAPYYGRDGLSLRLDGLDAGFNDNASNRSVVMHGGWYVEENFIKKYGRPGRSWGCPALPIVHTAEIINTIKNKSLLVSYYPNDHWFVKSKFLNCQNTNIARQATDLRPDDPTFEENNPREDVLFAGIHKRFHSEESDPVVAMNVDSYTKIFKKQPPLGRMLRRQINQTEYIALSEEEFKAISIQNEPNNLGEISFVVPVIKTDRGYNKTELHIVNLGKIKEIHVNGINGDKVGQELHYSINFYSNSSVNLWISKHFIRWVGL